SIIGVPGIYFHSLFGSRGWIEGARQTGRNRTINREKLQFDELQNQLADENSLRFKVFTKYRKLLKTRRSSPAFDPHGTQIIHDPHPAVFALERVSPDGQARMLCLHNVSRKSVSFSVNEKLITLEPYQALWLNNPQLI
ncbi:MAG: sugar phosphorylase, partial [Chloroflexi bacterium]|nr:sugar phosphorylase [Chloroflexota bacterium]